MPARIQIDFEEDFADELLFSPDDDYPEIKAANIQLIKADNGGPLSVVTPQKGKSFSLRLMNCWASQEPGPWLICLVDVPYSLMQKSKLPKFAGPSRLQT